MLESLSFSGFDMWRQKQWLGTALPLAPTYCIVARIRSVDQSFWIDGAILSLASGTVLFREASHYILKRHHEEVVIEIEDSEHPARIITTHNHGYLAEFLTPLPESFVVELQARWRIES